MNFYIYKLKFLSATHFGISSLDESGSRFYADTLFSALCIEALKKGGTYLEKLVKGAKTGEFILSDSFPYIENTFYIPKPILKIENKKGWEDPTKKKALKKLTYIPVDQLELYQSGQYDPEVELEHIKELGQHDMKLSASITYEEEEAMPFWIDMFRFSDGNGLYILCGYQTDEMLELTEALLKGLSYSGIGGKRSSGFGRFEFLRVEPPKELLQLITGGDYQEYMTLSVALPREDELERALEQATYGLEKRSGFIYSDTYAKDFMRKRDFYVMKAGSCFKTRFEGDLYDVSIDRVHPVYRYAKPLFLGINLKRTS